MLNDMVETIQFPAATDARRTTFNAFYEEFSALKIQVAVLTSSLTSHTSQTSRPKVSLPDFEKNR